MVMRWVRRAGTAVMTLAVLIGVPAVLISLGPAAPRRPSTADMARWVADPLTPATVRTAALAVAWLVWAATVGVLVARLLHGRRRARRRAAARAPATAAPAGASPGRGRGRGRSLRLSAPWEATAAGMAGAAAFAVPATTAIAWPQPAVAAPADNDDPCRNLQRSTDTISTDTDTDTDTHTDFEADGVCEVEAGRDGVPLMDGWLPPALVYAVTVAVQIIWYRRRRDYRPTHFEARSTAPSSPPGQPVGPDSTGQEAIPAAAFAVGAAAARTPTELVGSAFGDGGPPVWTPWDLTPGGRIGLTGPGALAAARGLIVTAVLDPREPRQRRIAVTAAAGRTLFDRDALPATVDVLDDVAALSLPAPPTADDPVEPGAVAEYGLIVVNAGEVPPGSAGEACLSRAPMLVLGDLNHDLHHDSEHSDTWLVTADGHVTPTADPGFGGGAPHGTDTGGARRLCVLDVTTALDLIALGAAAYPPEEPPATPPPIAAVAPAAITHPGSTPGAALRTTRTEHGHDTPRLDATPPRSVPAERGAAPLALRVLGPIAVFAGAADLLEPVPVRRSAARQVLTYLAVHPDGATADELLSAIWPDLPHHSISSRLYTTVSELRRTLRAAAGADPIDRVEHRYRLDPDVVDVDLWRLHTAARNATSSGTAAGRTAALHRVIGHYTGDLAAGHTWPWMRPARDACLRIVLDAYATLADEAPTTTDALTLLQTARQVDSINTALADRVAELRRRTGHPGTSTG
jgi:DNA-binding SARP family transcriptional activator